MEKTFLTIWTKFNLHMCIEIRSRVSEGAEAKTVWIIDQMFVNTTCWVIASGYMWHHTGTSCLQNSQHNFHNKNKKLSWLLYTLYLLFLFVFYCLYFFWVLSRTLQNQRLSQVLSRGDGGWWRVALLFCWINHFFFFNIGVRYWVQYLGSILCSMLC